MKLIYSSILIVAIFFMYTSHTKAETVEENAYTQKTIKSSLYKKIEFLDTRPSNEYNNIKIDSKIFQNDLQKFVDQTVDNTALNGTLVVNLRYLDIYFDKKKDCYIGRIRINLFDHINQNYYNLNLLDKEVEIPKNQDPNIIISDIIYAYISENLSQKINDSTPYLIDDIRNFDLMEKLKMPLFSNGILTDGIYSNYADFRDQYPLDDLLTVEFRDGELYNARATNKEVNKSIDIDPKEIYAIVVNGQAYIAVDNGFIPLDLENNDFWFIKDTEARDVYIRSKKIKTGKGKQKINVVYRIDHISGNPIQTTIR